MEEEKDYKTDAERAGDASTWKKNAVSTEDYQPVVYVSWKDAEAFCKWLSRKEGQYYDLPTESEWEYACRAGLQGAFCFGNNQKELGDYAWFDQISGGKIHPVRKKKANRWGLYDMHGNVREWCKDSKRKYPTREEVEKRNGPFEDPVGGKIERSRVLRGGSWRSAPRLCRSAQRDDDLPVSRSPYYGFRVVLRGGVRAP